MRNGLAIISGTILLAGCATASVAPVAAPAPSYTNVGLERVIGKNAGTLTNLFGQPDADVREGDARKLQFASGICVLDAYLYPKGQAEPVVTYLDARQPDGRPIDRASCVAALVRRDGAGANPPATAAPRRSARPASGR